jgi:hypothetical protein
MICGTLILKKIWNGVGAVEHGRLDRLLGDAAQRGRQDHHGEAGLDPDQDHHQEEVVPERDLSDRSTGAGAEGHRDRVDQADVAALLA